MSEITTNVPQPTFGPNGFIIPAESAILAGVLADFQAAFGGNLNTQLDTPQGQLASSLTAIIGFCYGLFQAYTNQIDPSYALGRMQDAIARIYFLERDPAEPTTVQATCTGLQGTVIPTGAQAVNADGNIYLCTTGGTIPSSGTVSLPFQCSVTGPIACPAGTLTQIYQAVPGWDTITNPSDGVEGSDEESRQAFETRRQQSVAKNAVGSLPAILGAVLDVPNVLDAYVTENATNSPLTVGGVTLIANSLYVAVAGGSQAAIAQAIWPKKSPGCSYNGNTTVTVMDSNSGYSPPFPSYSVTFEVPTSLPIFFAISITNSTAVPSNALALIQAAIMSAFTGSDGGTRARIGSIIYSLRYYAGIAALGSWAQVISIQVGITSPGAANDVTVPINNVPTLDPANITLTLV